MVLIKHLKTKDINTSNVVLTIIGILVIGYVVADLIIFNRKGIEPTTLTVSVFGATTGELGILRLIYKDKKSAEQTELAHSKDMSDTGGQNTGGQNVCV